MAGRGAVFVRDGALFVPTGLGASPWTDRTIGGVALVALSTHLMEAVPAPVPMHPARISIDIFGAVPMAPLTGTARIVRDGRRVQLLEATLESGGRTWARATMLRVRVEATPPVALPLTRGFPDGLENRQRNDMFESIPLDGPPGTLGVGARWVNFAAETVAGTPSSVLERVAMIADFGSGISGLFPFRDWTFANLDITVYLTRLPRGEWLLIDARSESAGNGVSLALGQIGDRDGMIGHSTQTVFLARR